MSLDSYTFSERTVKKYKVAQAVESAKYRRNGGALNLDSIRSRQFSDLITLKELNEIADEIVSDSENWYYND